jgi:hypothetical protein
MISASLDGWPFMKKETLFGYAFAISIPEQANPPFESCVHVKAGALADGDCCSALAESMRARFWAQLSDGSRSRTSRNAISGG